MSNSAAPQTRNVLSGISETPNAPVESKMSAVIICPAITNEKTIAVPNLGIAIKDATR
jgi:hypothetical protein